MRNWLKGDGKRCEWCRVKRTRNDCFDWQLGAAPTSGVLSWASRPGVCNWYKGDGKSCEWWREREPDGTVSSGNTVSSWAVAHSVELWEPFQFALHLESCQCTVYFQQDHWSVSDVWSLSKSGVLVVVPAPAVSILYTRNANVTSLSSSRDQPTHLRTRSSIKSCFIGYRFRSHFSPRYGSSYFYFNY